MYALGKQHTQEKQQLLALMRMKKKAPRDLDVQNGGLLDLDAHDGDLLGNVSAPVAVLLSCSATQGKIGHPLSDQVFPTRCADPGHAHAPQLQLALLVFVPEFVCFGTAYSHRPAALRCSSPQWGSNSKGGSSRLSRRSRPLQQRLKSIQRTPRRSAWS